MEFNYAIQLNILYNVQIGNIKLKFFLKKYQYLNYLNSNW